MPIRGLISLSEFKTVIAVATHATSVTKLLISDKRTVIVDTLAFLHGFDGEVIPVSEVHELLRFITYFRIFFNSASRQCDEDWALQFIFLHTFKDTVPPSEACLCP